MTSESSAPTLKEASSRYRESAGDQYRKPDRNRSYYDRGGWHLLTATGELVAIVPDERAPLFGNALNALYRQLQLGMAAPRR